MVGIDHPGSAGPIDLLHSPLAAQALGAKRLFACSEWYD